MTWEKIPRPLAAKGSQEGRQPKNKQEADRTPQDGARGRPEVLAADLP